MYRNSSSIQLRGSIATRTDPRNITDKNFIGTSVRILLDYLTEHNYPQVISPKILTRPSSKDFNNIILFLFLQIDPNFKLTGKFEDEVIAMFKQLKYPYQISKTSLVAVGTPHTWPALLATILWMIELLSYDEEVITSNKKQELDFDPDDSTASEKAFYSYLHNSYQFFLSGDDTTCDDLESQFLATFDVQNNTIVNQIQAMDDRNAALELEILNIEKHHAILPELQHKKLDYIKDIEKFKSLIQQLKKHKEQLESKSSERHSECCRIEASIVGIQQEIEELKQTISTQG
jgi:kinetochore protein NDC80